MRNFLIIVIGIVVLNGVMLYSGGFDFIRAQFEPAAVIPSVQPDVVDTFRQTLQAEVNSKVGIPTEGYDPQMFMAAFPGLVQSDFNGVESSIGKYVLRNGRLEHEMGEARLVHSAAGAITRKGMETLYRNVAARIGIDLEHGGTLTDVMRAVTIPR